MGSCRGGGVLWRDMGFLWGFMGSYRILWGWGMGFYGVPMGVLCREGGWEPMRVPWGPIGSYKGGVRGPQVVLLGRNGVLWGPIGSYGGERWRTGSYGGPMGGMGSYRVLWGGVVLWSPLGGDEILWFPIGSLGGGGWNCMESYWVL